MAATNRVCRIKLEIDLLAHDPTHEIKQHRPAEHVLHEGEVPFQQPHFDLRVLLDQPQNVGPEASRESVLAPLLPPAPPCRQHDARIEVPPDQEDALARTEHSPAHNGEIVGRIDAQVRAIRHDIAPDRRPSLLFTLGFCDTLFFHHLPCWSSHFGGSSLEAARLFPATGWSLARLSLLPPDVSRDPAIAPQATSHNPYR